PHAESFWVAKAPLWLIAVSLFTIACCLVLLVIRTTVGEGNPQASANTNEAPTVAQNPADWKPRRIEDQRRAHEFVVSHEEPSAIKSTAGRTDAVVPAVETSVAGP